tara:strand:+ start:378 stop:584 length:207 start_codon:yes stop_codon:yes gene_type:complete
MTDDSDSKRVQRLERARAFLAAGRTQIDPRPPSANPAPPQAGEDGAKAARPDPTRFGDWEKNGRCIDF